MLNNKLNVGDYIFTANGELARITKINKITYSYETITDGYASTENVSFNGIKHDYWGGKEWFECSDGQAKALELAMKKYQTYQTVKEIQQEVKTLLGKAKFFLTQLEDVSSIDVEEEK